ncbi:MAG: (Fe-S)-binding protein, partial [Candidatus Hodarchaeota archaeon]
MAEDEPAQKAITSFNPDLAEQIKESGGITLDYCFQCGTCTGICPWGEFIQFSSRRIIRQAQLGLFDPKSDNTWLCTTCLQCLEVCPRGVRIPDIMAALRAIALEDGRNIPTTVTNALDSLFENGNPWLRPKRERMDWAKDLDVRVLEKKDTTDVLYFVGCTASYDPRAQNIAKAMVKILNHLEVDWGVLKDEKDCGNCAKTLGEDMLFDALSKDNKKKLKKMAVQRIITTSPHSYSAHKMYELGENIKIQHYTEFLAEKIRDGTLKFTNSIDKKVTYHDPCYLGRHHNIFEEPREVLKAIPGIQLVEMKRNRKFAMCCGGGGG